jgi:hypothetical protein
MDNGTYLVSDILAGLIGERNALWFGRLRCNLLPGKCISCIDPAELAR